jgi:hypothetical protein
MATRAKRPAPAEVAEPPEAKPPQGVTLDDDGSPVEATDAEMAALAAVAGAEVASRSVQGVSGELRVTAPVPVSPPAPIVVGSSLCYVTGRANLDAFGALHAPGDVVPAVVVAVNDDGTVDVRCFPLCEGVPLVRSVPVIVAPDEVALEHAGRAFRP